MRVAAAEFMIMAVGSIGAEGHIVIMVFFARYIDCLVRDGAETVIMTFILFLFSLSHAKNTGV